MRVVFSRKGMDTTSGGMPSPILPDGTLLSIPAPNPTAPYAYSQIYYHGMSLEEIIRQLHPKYDFSKHAQCAIEPDLRGDIEGARPSSTWVPCFSQGGRCAAHLDAHKVGPGDIFLFYGSFQRTLFDGDSLHFVRHQPVVHLIFAYMVVDKVLTPLGLPMESFATKHFFLDRNPKPGHIYLPATYGCLTYNECLALTKLGQPNRSVWKLPVFFAGEGIEMSWQGKTRPERIQEGGESFAQIQVSPNGPESVVTPKTIVQEKNLNDWVTSFFQYRAKEEHYYLRNMA